MKAKKLIWSLLICSTLVNMSCSEKKDSIRIIDNKYREVIKESRKEAIFYMARSFVPGSSLAVSVKGKLVYSEGLGLASKDLEVPATRYTKYRIGGITQVLTSLAYYKMIEEGKLDPDSTIQKYLPDFPEKEYPLKLQNLVDQTSGIRTPTEEELSWRGLNVGVKRGIESFAKDSLLFPPGMYQYTTIFSFNLLGAVMEEVEAEPFSKLLRTWVTDTLGMENTVPDNPLSTVKGRSDFFDRDMVAQVINATFRDLRYRMPSDGYLSTAEDLVKLGNALLYGNGMSETVKGKMLTAPQAGEIPLRVGNGFLFLQNGKGDDFYAARGNIIGGGAMLIIYPKDEIVVAWLSNIDDALDELPGLMVANNFSDFERGNFKTKEEKMKEEEKEAVTETEK
jgi:serine beta-lactamase-like protein LACTB, mitochondrial